MQSGVTTRRSGSPQEATFFRLALRVQPDNLRCGGTVPQPLDILRSDPS